MPLALRGFNFCAPATLKLPATSCGESPIVKENVYFLFARIPRRKQRGMRALFNSNGSFSLFAF